MTQYLENMKIGDTILIRGPTGRLFYHKPGTGAAILLIAGRFLRWPCCGLPQVWGTWTHTSSLHTFIHMNAFIMTSVTHICCTDLHASSIMSSLLSLAQKHERCLLRVEGFTLILHSLALQGSRLISVCLRKGPAIPWDASPRFPLYTLVASEATVSDSDLERYITLPPKSQKSFVGHQPRPAEVRNILYVSRLPYSQNRQNE